MRKQKWILRWKEILAVGGSFVVVPVILNYALFTWRAPQTYGDGDTWLGFWGITLELLLVHWLLCGLLVNKP